MDEQPPQPPVLPDMPAAPMPGDGGLPSGAEPVAMSAPAPSRKRRNAFVAGLVILTVLIGGAATAFVKMRGSSESLTSMMPANSQFAATMYLDPAASQKLNLERLALKVSDFGNNKNLVDQVNTVLDSALSRSGLTHEDVRPWLGSEVGVAGRTGDDAGFAVYLQTSDESAAQAALAKFRNGSLGKQYQWRDETRQGTTISIGTSSSNGDTAYAMVKGVVLIGDLRGVESAVDTSAGVMPPLADSPNFISTVSSLPHAKLAMAYVDLHSLVGQFAQSAAASGADVSGLGQLEAATGLGASVSAEPQGIAVDVTVSYDQSKLTADQREALGAADHPNALGALVPADAYGVILQQHLDTSLNAAVDQIVNADPSAAAALQQAGVTGVGGVLSTLTGDMAMEVGPGASGSAVPAGAIMVGTTDAATMQKFLDTATTFLLQNLGASGSTSFQCQGVAVAQSTSACGGTSFAPVGCPPGFSKKMCQQLKRSQQSQGSLIEPPAPPKPHTETYEGVKITSFQDPAFGSSGFAPAYAVVDGAGVIATSPEAIKQLIDTKASGQTLASTTAYRDATAKVSSSDGLMYFDIQKIAGAIRDALPPDEQAQFDQNVGPELKALQAFVVGSSSDPSHQTVRLFLFIP
jgi:hypothetical protein